MARFEKTQRFLFLAITALAVMTSSAAAQTSSSADSEQTMAASSALTPAQARVTYGSVKVDGVKIAYGEAGDPASPKLVLLHGFPASSPQYRNLLPALAGRFHVISPDYPGFGNSDVPDPAMFAYTFDRISAIVEDFLKLKGFDHYGLFVQDYGGARGVPLLRRTPESPGWVITQKHKYHEIGVPPH